jgi:hypothetical protein
MQQFREFEVDGQRIAASLHIPEQTPAPAVVMCHGFTGQRMEAHLLFVKAARSFCSNGLNVLRFDFRGSGESDGRFRDMTVSREIEDALEALRFIRAEPTVDESRTGLVGLSLGGLVAACAAARDGDVDALALWSAVADLRELIEERWQMPSEPGTDGRDYYEHGSVEIGAEFLRDAVTIDPLGEIGSFSAPVLVVHGDGDEAVPLEHAHRYMKAVPDEGAELRIVRGADHTFSSIALERQVIATTLEFLRDKL